MPVDRPYVREAGAGPGVVCLHANAGNSAQWRELMDRLSPTYRVLAPDSYGAGRSADWISDRTIALSDETAFVEPVLETAGAPCVLVGHSYGGAVALIAALANPARIRALVLYEPTLFALVDAAHPPPNGIEGIRNTVRASAAALDAGDRDAAAMHFIDFWMGAGSWAQTPAQRKPAIMDSIVNVRRWAHALLTEPTPAEAFAALDMPVLYLMGESSPESAHAVARVLLPHLPRARALTLAGVGHMAPVTHPDAVNAAIADFLSTLPG
jgi:pimeloyl-ACP methyl ester carboxylesterase